MQIPVHHIKQWQRHHKKIQYCEQEDFMTVQDNSSNVYRNSKNNIQHFEYQSQQQNKKSFEFNFKVMYSGYLYKKTLNMTWCQRYFCLTPSRLLYYTDQKQHELKGCFNFGSLSLYKLQVISNFPEIILKIVISQLSQKQEKNILKLKIQSKPIHQEWAKRLKLAIQKNKKISNFSPIIGSQIQIDTHTILGQKQNYWNKLFISTNQLIQYSDHLDLIFFKSNGALSYLNRLFMRSYYDHIGILIKGEINQLYIFEAIQSRGVWIVDWQAILQNIQQMFQQIGYRKLIVPLGIKISPQQLQDYINALIGKKYELSMSKLISGNIEQIQDENKENIENKKKIKHIQNDSYFCSELVADVYMKFGILKKGKKHQYWPKQFQGNIALQKGMQLSPMMSVQIKKPW